MGISQLGKRSFANQTDNIAIPQVLYLRVAISINIVIFILGILGTFWKFIAILGYIATKSKTITPNSGFISTESHAKDSLVQIEPINYVIDSKTILLFTEAPHESADWIHLLVIQRKTTSKKTNWCDRKVSNLSFIFENSDDLTTCGQAYPWVHFIYFLWFFKIILSSYKFL